MWLIGDIHGCLRELELLLAKLPKEEKLLFLGDYIDRGPDSSGVVSRLLREKERSIFLVGNHEDMLLAYYKRDQSPARQSWLLGVNGGQNTLLSYGLNPEDSFEKLPASHREFYMKLKLYYEAPDFIAVHAGLRVEPPFTLESQKRSDLLWIRHEWLRNESLWPGKKIYYGHTPSRFVLGPERENETIQGERSRGIDTGCVFGGSLTALRTEDEAIIQVPFQAKPRRPGEFSF